MLKPIVPGPRVAVASLTSRGKRDKVGGQGVRREEDRGMKLVRKAFGRISSINRRGEIKWDIKGNYNTLYSRLKRNSV